MESSKWSHFRMRNPQKQWFSIHDPAGSQGISWTFGSTKILNFWFLGSPNSKSNSAAKTELAKPFRSSSCGGGGQLGRSIRKACNFTSTDRFQVWYFLLFKVCVWPVGVVFFIYFLMAPLSGARFFVASDSSNQPAETHQKNPIFLEAMRQRCFFPFGWFQLQRAHLLVTLFGSKFSWGIFHHDTTQPPKTSTKTATCQCQFRILSYSNSNSVSGSLKKHHCNHWWLKLFRCLFFKQDLLIEFWCTPLAVALAIACNGSWARLPVIAIGILATAQKSTHKWRNQLTTFHHSSTFLNPSVPKGGVFYMRSSYNKQSVPITVM